MKMKLIPAAILAAMSMVGAAQAQVSVYGLVDAGFSHTDAKDSAGNRFDDAIKYSNNSTTRVGVKGTGDLGSGIKGSFDLQAGNVTAKKTSDAFFDRQAWVGLGGSFGEVRFGTQDSAAFKSLIGFDLNGAANDTQSSYLAGLNTLGQNALGGSKELANYISPNMGGLQATVGVNTAGNQKGYTTNAAGVTLPSDPKAKSNLSLAVNYGVGGLSAGGVYESASTDDTTKQNSNAYAALAASYDLGLAKIAAIVVNGGNGQRGAQYGISAPVAGGTVGIQYAKNTDSGTTGTEFFWGKDVLKNTTAYAEYGIQSPAAGDKINVYSVGLIYVF